MCEAEKVKCLGFAFPARSSVVGCMAAELYESCFVGVQLETKLLESLAQFAEESFRLVLMLEPCDVVVSVPDDDDIALCCFPSPLFDPQIENVVQVDICK